MITLLYIHIIVHVYILYTHCIYKIILGEYCKNKKKEETKTIKIRKENKKRKNKRE